MFFHALNFLPSPLASSSLPCLPLARNAGLDGLMTPLPRWPNVKVQVNLSRDVILKNLWFFHLVQEEKHLCYANHRRMSVHFLIDQSAKFLVAKILVNS